jgi:hypothetical protein
MATLGRLGYLKVLLKEALYIALEENYDMLTFPILAKAFENKLRSICNKNPFLPGYNLKYELSKLSK